MSIKVLHIVGGASTNGAAKGACILHEALIELNINSHLLNDTSHQQYHLVTLVKNYEVL